MTRLLKYLTDMKTHRFYSILLLAVPIFCFVTSANGQIPGQPANSRVSGSDWYCVGGYKKSGNACVSIFSSNPATPASASTQSSQTQPTAGAPVCAENNSCYGDISENTGRPKTIHVEGYYRKDGTYVRGHYRSKPR